MFSFFVEYDEPCVEGGSVRVAGLCFFMKMCESVCVPVHLTIQIHQWTLVLLYLHFWRNESKSCFHGQFPWNASLQKKRGKKGKGRRKTWFLVICFSECKSRSSLLRLISHSDGLRPDWSRLSVSNRMQLLFRYWFCRNRKSIPAWWNVNKMLKAKEENKQQLSRHSLVDCESDFIKAAELFSLMNPYCTERCRGMCSTYRKSIFIRTPVICHAARMNSKEAVVFEDRQ